MRDYYNRVLVPFVDDIVLDRVKRTPHGYELDFNDLPDDEKQAIVVHFIEHDDRDLIALYESNEFISSLVQYLKEGQEDYDSRDDFIKAVKGSLLSYYKRSIETLLRERIGALEQIEHEEAGFARAYHADNGESFWVRSHG